MTEILATHVREAHERIRGHVHRTPVLTSTRINELSGAEVFFKCENFQKTGAFKARGAANAVLSLSEAEAARGVATHSSGNHAAALSWAARLRGIRSTVVMPRTASRDDHLLRAEPQGPRGGRRQGRAGDRGHAHPPLQ
jgi:threonine dehydratase